MRSYEVCIIKGTSTGANRGADYVEKAMDLLLDAGLSSPLPSPVVAITEWMKGQYVTVVVCLGAVAIRLAQAFCATKHGWK